MMIEHRDDLPVNILLLVGFALLTIINIIFYGQHLHDDYQERIPNVYNDPVHNGRLQHYDIEVSMYSPDENIIDTYFIDFVNNRVFSNTDTTNIYFEHWIDLQSWIAKRSKERAFQANVVLGHFRAVFTDPIHRDTSQESRLREDIINTLESIARDSFPLNDTIPQ